MDGVFVTGTDTEVGKTTVCAGLLKLIHGTRKVCYWKPIQTGTIIGDDTEDVKFLTDLNDCIVPSTYRFTDAQAPYLAAKKWGKEIDIDQLSKVYEAEKKEGKFVIVEGSGGILVPLTQKYLQVELIKRLRLQVLIVGVNRLGIINMTLLTLRACKDEGVPVLGILLNRSKRNPGTKECIEQFGKTPVLAEFDEVDDRRTLVANIAGDPGLRKLFNVKVLPV